MLQGEIPVDFIYEDEKTFAILDHNPVSRGHALVITKRQIDQLDDCDDELYQAVFSTVRKVSRHLLQRLSPKRIALVVHGTEIPHVHVHVVPLYTEKELNLANRSDDTVLDQAVLAELTEQLKLSAV